jgi:hypothetical protein
MLNSTMLQSLLKQATNQYVLRTQVQEIIQSKYSMTDGKPVGILPDPLLCKHEMLSLIRKAVAGTMTIQIPRLALNAKYAQGRDVALKITIEGYVGNWKEIESTDTDSTLDIFIQ